VLVQRATRNGELSGSRNALWSRGDDCFAEHIFINASFGSKEEVDLQS
jgi:hypothetical protein